VRDGRCYAAELDGPASDGDAPPLLRDVVALAPDKWRDPCLAAPAGTPPGIAA
jgi:hypothetical protein